jgi:hypothetical protein
MPPGTTLRTFIEAIQTGQTKTTRALDDFFRNPGGLDGHPGRKDFKNAGAFNALPGWATTALQPHLSALELAHIDSWPNDQKDNVRAKLDQAIHYSRNAVHFFWQPHPGNSEEVEIIDPDQDGDITIIFKSPRNKITQTATQVTVDV